MVSVSPPHQCIVHGRWELKTSARAAFRLTLLSSTLLCLLMSCTATCLQQIPPLKDLLIFCTCTATFSHLSIYFYFGNAIIPGEKRECSQFPLVMNAAHFSWTARRWGANTETVPGNPFSLCPLPLVAWWWCEPASLPLLAVWYPWRVGGPRSHTPPLLPMPRWAAGAQQVPSLFLFLSCLSSACR